MRLRASDAPTGSAGYTLVELLTIVAIIATLAAIAIPMVTSQRQSAWASAVESDVRSTAALIVSSSGQGAPEGLVHSGRTVQLLSSAPAAAVTRIAVGSTTTDPAVVAEARVSPGVQLCYQRDEDNVQDFCLTGYHERLGEQPAAVFDSTAGGLVDRCSLTASHCPAPGGELLLAGGPPFFESRWDDATGRWTYGQQNGNSDAGRALADPRPVTNGSLLLSNAAFTGSRSSGYGWGITYGTHDENGNMRSGYTLQLDPGFGSNGGFVIRTWDGSGTHDWRYTPQSVAVPDGFDFSDPQDVEARVEDGHLSLYVGGERYLHYEMGSAPEGGRSRYAAIDGQEATFGVRTWGGEPEVSFDEAQLTVHD